MLYKFKSQATADLIMTEPVGDRLLRLIGREPEPRGILTVEELPAAILALTAAIEADEAARRARPADEPGDDEAKEAAAQRDRISLRQRAWPLVEMMKRALAAREAIVWGV